MVVRVMWRSSDRLPVPRSVPVAQLRCGLPAPQPGPGYDWKVAPFYRHLSSRGWFVETRFPSADPDPQWAHLTKAVRHRRPEPRSTQLFVDCPWNRCEPFWKDPDRSARITHRGVVGPTRRVAVQTGRLPRRRSDWAIVQRLRVHTPVVYVRRRRLSTDRHPIG